MNTKLFYILLFITSISYAQIPTNGLVANYQFNNSSATTDSNASGTNLSQTGTASIASTDRFGNTDALSLNGDVLYRTDMPTTSEDLTLNFWIKTTSSSASGEIIINDTNDDSIGAFATPFSSSSQGYMVYIQGGRIKVKVASKNGGNLYVPANTHQNDILVNDGEWHHVSVYLKEHFIPIFTGSTVNYVGHDIKITIDNQIDPAIQTNVSANQHSGTLSGSIHGVGNFHIGDKPTPSNPLNFYTSEIDDLLVYDRELTAAELTQITNIGGYCTTPQFGGLASFTSTNTNNTISFSLPDTDMYGVAYHLASEPFSHAIIINGLSNANTSGVILANLNENSIYSIYIRKQCTNTTDWSTPRTIKTERPTSTTRLYVNGSATGANNGLSWADAYTDANDAFINAADNDEIWIAAGTYKPHATNRTIFFTVDKENLKIYGGFVGTETTLSQRDFRANVTNLSGDIGQATTGDNSYHVLYIEKNGTNIDGITISDGNAFGQGNDNSGGGIFKLRPVNSLTIKNCIIKYNFANNAAGIIAEYESAGGDLDIDNCVFDNNVSRFGSAVYAQTRNPGTFTFNVSNSLFNNNKAQDMTTGGFAGSAGFFQTNNSASVANVKLVNNTYVNNSDTGSGLNNLTRGTVGASEASGTLNLEVANCIFYDNTIVGGVVANAITGLNGTLGANTTVINSIDQDGFSKLNPANLTGTISSDPLFTSTTDFTLQTGSLAIDTGDNSKVPTGLTTDLLGNQRIHNTTVDMGAYEFGSSILGIDNVNKIEGLKMYPNPTKGNLTFDLQEQIKTIELYNLQGQVVMMFTSKKVDINSVTKGIYMVKITTESGKVAIKKIVKN
jgi:hypothetical protein